MTRRYIVPGRVELVGKHVDYAGGRSLTCAVAPSLHVRAEPLRQPVIRVSSSVQAHAAEIELGSQHAVDGWHTYVATVARRFARDFPHWRAGVDVRIDGDLPASAGLSSSSALVVAMAMALADVNDAEADEEWRRAVPDALARADYFAAVETGAPFKGFAGDDGVGVRGGAQDHIAILCATAGALTQFSYLPARMERRVPWPADHVLAIGVSGVRATKTENARRDYNRASDAMRALVGRWNLSTGRDDHTIAGALNSGPDAAGRLAGLARLPASDFAAGYLERRLSQFREETEVIVPGVGDALRDRDFAALGRLVDRSQAMAEAVLGNQVPETIALARLARERGAVAASAFGAGFGGAVWAMVPASAVDTFADDWRGGYISAFPERAVDARWIVTRPSEPARVTGPES